MVEKPTYPGMPRWVKISGMIAGLVIALAIVVIVFGIGGPHGPGRHFTPTPADNEILPTGDNQ
jgi:hypothetical protein